MDGSHASPSERRRVAAAVLGVGVIQVVVFVVTTGFWMGRTLFAGGACEASCDEAGGQWAAVAYFGLAALSFAISIAAAFVGYRTGRDLAWVPLAASVLIVVGYVIASGLFAQAMG